MLSAHHSAAVTTPPDGIWELLVPAGRLHPGSSAAAAPPTEDGGREELWRVSLHGFGTAAE